MKQELIERFERLLLETKRPGIENLLEFIRKSDFYTAPASTRFHGAYEGGLLEHSLNVYDCLANKWELDSGFMTFAKRIFTSLKCVTRKMNLAPGCRSPFTQ